MFVASEMMWQFLVGLLVTHGLCEAVVVPANDTAIVYSPYVWSVTPSGAASVNAGAYFRTLFSGNHATLLFDVSSMVSPPSQVCV
jgi:hypothetical protein